ncbi:hypothetical protein FNH13_17620 [Ornithinimicrobium ciconiae]|uniref:HEPN domain-containing protein n=1 Tax=Ornithinimicrobium ciconiae TaxID=2594265 RepID=A0A516GF06_9MICO|nr:hypothetical protein [Ornithinimicrobium ciconiae]QDO89920.1 hypothetical protein FNH13_17620 [Ornithinimicrobium ciconiae]
MTVEDLIEGGRLLRVEPDRRLVDELLATARTHTRSAEVLQAKDPWASVVVATAAVRGCLLAVLQTRGLAVAPAADGGDTLLAALAELGDVPVDLPAVTALLSQHRHGVSTTVTATEVEDALRLADATLSRVAAASPGEE